MLDTALHEPRDRRSKGLFSDRRDMFKDIKFPFCVDTKLMVSVLVCDISIGIVNFSLQSSSKDFSVTGLDDTMVVLKTVLL